jgi:hypothetical protein
MAFVDPNQQRRSFQNATDQLGEIHGPLPHERDTGGRRWLWVGIGVGAVLLVLVVVLTFTN